MNQRRLFYLALFACGAAIMLLANWAPGALAPLGWLGRAGVFLAPGIMLVAAVGIAFPTLMLDPLRDLGDATGEELARREIGISLLVFLACLLGGSLGYWWLLQ